MDRLNLIDFDEVELIREENATPTTASTASAAPATAAVSGVVLVDEDDDDEALLIVDSQQPPRQQTVAVPDDVIDDNNEAGDICDDLTPTTADPVVLPPEADILPPSTAGQVRRLPRLDTDNQRPPPEVNTGEDEVVSSRFCRRVSLGLGVSQLIVGMVSFCLGVLSIPLAVNFSVVGHGIWAGFVCVVAGFVGMASYRRVTAARVIMYMIVSIMATVCSATMFGLAVVACLRRYPMGTYDDRYSYFQFSASLGINLLMSIIAMLAMTLTITSWIITCRASSSGSCFGCHCCLNRSTANVQLQDAYYYRSHSDPSSVVCEFADYSQPPAYTPSVPPPAYAETLPANHSRQK